MARILLASRRGISDSTYLADNITDSCVRGRPYERNFERVSGLGDLAMKSCNNAATSGEEALRMRGFLVESCLNEHISGRCNPLGGLHLAWCGMGIMSESTSRTELELRREQAQLPVRDRLCLSPSNPSEKSQLPNRGRTREIAPAKAHFTDIADSTDSISP